MGTLETTLQTKNYGWKCELRLIARNFGMDLDLVPAFKDEDERYYIFDFEREEWIGNNPVAVYEALEEEQRHRLHLIEIIGVFKRYNHNQPYGWTNMALGAHLL